MSTDTHTDTDTSMTGCRRRRPTTDVVPVSGVALTRLLQLVSPALPIGAFAYSQGLEQAVASGWVTDEASAAEWLLGLLHHGLATLDLPVLERLIDAWRADDRARVDAWSAWLAACRADARDARGGAAARRRRWRARWRRSASRDAEPAGRRARTSRRRRCSRSATARYAIPTSAALAGYAFAWAEATTSAAVRLVPLGPERRAAAARGGGRRDPRGGRAGARPRRRRAGGDRARPGDRQRAARGPLQPVVPIMTPACNRCASASPAPSARARPRWSTRCASGCATATTSPSSPTTSTPRRTPSS